MTDLLKFKSEWTSSQQLVEELYEFLHSSNCEIAVVILHPDNACDVAHSDNLLLSQLAWMELNFRLKLDQLAGATKKDV